MEDESELELLARTSEGIEIALGLFLKSQGCGFHGTETAVNSYMLDIKDMLNGGSKCIVPLLNLVIAIVGLLDMACGTKKKKNK